MLLSSLLSPLRNPWLCPLPQPPGLGPQHSELKCLTLDSICRVFPPGPGTAGSFSSLSSWLEHCLLGQALSCMALAPEALSSISLLPSWFLVVQPTIATLPVHLFIHRTLPLDQKTHFLYHHCTCPCLKSEKKVKLMFRRRLLLMERRNQLQIKWESCTREMKIWQKPSFLQLYRG